MDSTTPREPALAYPPVVVGVAITIGLVLHFFLPIGIPLVPRVVSWLGAGLAFAGAFAISSATQRAMMTANTTLFHTVPTRVLLTSGPFRYSRNPIYLAQLLLMVGAGLALNGLLPLALIIPWMAVMQAGVIGPEERHLTQLFGDEYRAYCERVRRWI